VHFGRGVWRYTVLGTFFQVFCRGVSFVGKGFHLLEAQKLFGVQCHGREGVGVVYGARMVVDEQFVFCVAACLYVVAYVYDVAVQHHGPCVGIGKADLSFPAFP